MEEAVQAEATQPDMETACGLLRDKVAAFKTKTDEWTQSAREMIDAADAMKDFAKDGDPPPPVMTALGEMIMTLALCDKKMQQTNLQWSAKGEEQ